MKKITTLFTLLLLCVATATAQTAPSQLTNGWYQLRWVATNGSANSNYTDNEVSGKYVANYAQDVTVDSKLYPLYLSDSEPTTDDAKASTFVYYKVLSGNNNGKQGNLRSATGRYINTDGSSSLTAQNNYVIFFSAASYPLNSVITSGFTGTNRISLVPRGKGDTPYIGQTEAGKFPMVQFFPVNLSELGMQDWTVEITGITETLAADNVQLTYTGENGYGVKSVYNGGTLFLAAQTVPAANEFTVSGLGERVPAITVNSSNHTISVTIDDLTTHREALQAVVDAAKALVANVGEGMNQYTITNGQTAFEQALAAAEAELAKEDSATSKAALIAARETLEAAVAALTKVLNMPQAGFYRIKGKTSGKYVSNGNGNGGRYTMVENADETTVFCYDGTKLVNFQTGLCVDLPSWTWKYGNDDALSAVTFADGQSNGGYAIINGADRNNNPIHLYDNGQLTDRGAFATANITTVTGSERYSNWYLEEVTTLPLTLKAYEGKYYATFSSPVDVAAIDGATIYKLEVLNDKYIKYVDAETTGVPANVGVLLIGDAATATATIGTTTSNLTTDVTNLQPQLACEKGAGSTTNLYLGKSGDVLGFYKLQEWTTEKPYTTGSFKAYFVYSSGVGAKEGFELTGGETTGIETIGNGALNIENGTVYNLQGQKVTKAQKGVFIVNGKKIVK